MKANKTIIGIMAVTLTLAFGTTVYAQEFQSENGVVTIETADGQWEEHKDSSALMMLTDGENKITLQHFSNGEKFPEIITADDDYPMVCQNIISTKNEVFLVTGCAADRDDFEAVKKAVQGTVINQYDTKKAVKKSAGTSNGSDSSADGAGTDSSAGGSESVKKVSFTGWVTSDSVNVRGGASLSADVIGHVFLQEAVEVTGIAADGGWYRISYDGGEGYVSAEYISDEPSTAESQGIDLTDEAVTVYEADGDAAAYIYKSTDGRWYDGSGREYSRNGSGMWELLSNGSIWTEEKPGTPEENAADEVSVEDGGGNSQTLDLEENGEVNIAGGSYTDNGDGTYTGGDNTIGITN